MSTKQTASSARPPCRSTRPQQPAGRAGEVAAPDVGLQRLDPRAAPRRPARPAAPRGPGPRRRRRRAGWSATPRAGRSCGPRCAPARPASPRPGCPSSHQVVGELQRLDVGLGEGDRVVASGGRSRAAATAPRPSRGVRRPARPPGPGSGSAARRAGAPRRRRARRRAAPAAVDRRGVRPRPPGTRSAQLSRAGRSSAAVRSGLAEAGISLAQAAYGLVGEVDQLQRGQRHDRGGAQRVVDDRGLADDLARARAGRSPRRRGVPRPCRRARM